MQPALRPASPGSAPAGVGASTSAGAGQSLTARQQAIIPVAAFAAADDLPRLNTALNQALDAGLTRLEGRTKEHRAFLYISDHGQEVGHDVDRAGHSPNTPAGYRIPTIIWRSEPFADASQIAARPFRADWVAWTMSDLLGLQWKSLQPARNVLALGYTWEAPVLPFAVRDFRE